MSTCWKCGKELPGIETECQGACGADDQRPVAESAPLMLSIGIFPRPEIFDDPAMAAVRSTLADRLVAHERRPGERATPGVLMAPV